MAVAKTGSSDTTGWVGWVFFAAAMLMLSGFFQAIGGLIAIVKHSVYVVTGSHLLVYDYTQWGWTHLIIGIILIISAASLFSGNMWGRIVGVVMAGLSAIANFAFFQSAPWWSAAVITVDILVIYAITVHGGALKQE